MKNLKLTCAMHNEVVFEGNLEDFDSDKHNCPKCEELRNDWIRGLRREGWTDDRFRRAGWRKFEHIK